MSEAITKATPVHVTLVPVNVWIEKDMMGTVHIKRQHEGEPAFDFIQIQYNHRHTCNAHQHGIAEQIVALLNGAALSQAGQGGQGEAYTTIDMGFGKWEVGAGTNAGVPCIAFGVHGSGKVGELITIEPRQMSAEETHAVITFANYEGFAVLQEKMDEVRALYFSAAQPAPVASAATPECMAVYQSIADGYPQQPAPVASVAMSEAEQVACLVKSNCIGTVKMSFDSGPLDITRPSINASRLIAAVEAHHRIAPKPAPAVPADFDALVKKHARAQYSSSQRDWDVAEFTPEGLRMLVDALSAAPKPEQAGGTS